MLAAIIGYISIKRHQKRELIKQTPHLAHAVSPYGMEEGEE